MRHFAGAALALVLIAPGAVAQDSTRTQGIRIDIDRIVAVVGTLPILWSEVLEQVNIRRAQGIPVPEDPEEQKNFARQVLNEMVDVEVMVQKARLDTAIVVTDADLQDNVDRRFQQLKSNFKSDAELASALRNDGFGTVEEYRRWMFDQARRQSLQQKLVQKFRQDGKMVTVGVSEDEISEAFVREKERLPKRPATVTFRQLVIPTVASDSARKVALAKTEAILEELTKGGDFERIAKRESQDSASAVQGGDLGWNRRGAMVPAFDQMMFYLNVGQISPIVETQYGFHIIRVDRVNPSERKARHILIKPTLDSNDVARGGRLADSVLTLWKSGTNYDSLVARFHDLASDEMRGVLEPFERNRMPESYQEAFKDKVPGDFIGPFQVDDPRRGVPKFVIAQLITAADEGEYTVQDLRNQIRDQLSEEKSMRRLLDSLRRETFVAIMLEEKGAGTP